jgi:hypothetical protein
LVSQARAVNGGPDGDTFTIATGSVLNRGIAVSGAQVTGEIWPNAATLAALPDDATVPTLTLAPTTTGSNGSYKLYMNPASVPATYKEADGAISVETVATLADGSTMTWNNSVKYNTLSSAYQLTTTGANVAGSSTNSQLDVGSGLAFDSGDSAADYDNGTTAVTDSVSDPAIGTCTPFWVATSSTLKMQPEHFMNVDAWKGAPGVAIENENSSHTIGIGVSADGKFDDLKAGGKLSISLNDGSGDGDTAANLVNTAVYNAVNLRDFKLECAGHVFKGERRAVSVGDFLDRDFFHTFTHTYYYSSCSKKGVGDEAHTTTAHQVTFSGGMDIGPINVSAQSGYSSDTKISFTWNKVGYFCGNSDYGPLRSSQVSTQDIN